MTDEQVFEQLVDRARTGDVEAQSLVIKRLQPILRGFFVRRIGSTDDVDDLVQNTLMRVLRGFEDLKDSRSMRPFALKAALYELQDLYRGRYGAREGLLDPDAPEQTAPVTTEGFSIDFDRAMTLLSPKARTILELKAMGYRYEEIASMIESTEAAVKMQVKRAVERLRDFLEITTWLFVVLGPQMTSMLLFAHRHRL